jgi:hypothetical protein
MSVARIVVHGAGRRRCRPHDRRTDPRDETRRPHRRHRSCNRRSRMGECAARRRDEGEGRSAGPLRRRRRRERVRRCQPLCPIPGCRVDGSSSVSAADCGNPRRPSLPDVPPAGSRRDRKRTNALRTLAALACIRAGATPPYSVPTTCEYDGSSACRAANPVILFPFWPGLGRWPGRAAMAGKGLAASWPHRMTL